MKPIWIIDDDRSIRWVFEKALARADMEFRSFASAPDALAALAGDQPQVVVSDIRMPGGSGLDFLQEIKKRLPDVPVIIMTAYSDLESAVAAFSLVASCALSVALPYIPPPRPAAAADEPAFLFAAASVAAPVPITPSIIAPLDSGVHFCLK